MWIVRLALRRPYTFVVAALLVGILGILLIEGFFPEVKIPTDVFPEVNIPVISASFNYQGMSADDMYKYIISNFERSISTTVNDVEHTETQALNGIGVIKIYFQKSANIETALAQVTAIAQTAVRGMPPGTQPPLIIIYNASSVPILQLSVGSDTIPEQKLFDLAVNTLRPQLVTVPGVQIPYPYGGKQRQIVVDLDPNKLYAYGLSPADVSNAVNAQNLILPAGSTKIGTQEYQVRLNSTPPIVSTLNDLPIKTINGTTIYIKDVAHVRDGFSVQTNVVHSNGKPGVILTILKSGSASTLDVVDNIKAALPQIRKTLPPDFKISLVLDQSIFVRAAVQGVMKEALIAAGLTALMILLFLGSWRSTLIVMISIPLSILVSIIILYFLGQTLNVMTLGGMALAVGILVDDATVAIENIHRNLHQRKRLVKAILDGSAQIAVPAFVSTLCICIVFVPVVFISGAAKYLFTPLAMAVVFAMLTSYLLSRTLVPTMVHYLLAGEVERYGGVLDERDPHAQHAIHIKEALAHGQAVAPEDLGPGEHLRRWLSTRAGRLTLIVAAALLAVAISVLIAIGTTPLGEQFPVVHGFMAAVFAWVATQWRLLAQIVLGLLALVALVWLIVQLHEPFNWLFEKFRRIYGGFLDWSLSHRAVVTVIFAVLVIASCGLIYPRIGTDFFPAVDAGQMRMHVRCPPGTRLEESSRRFAQVEAAIRRIIPHNELGTVIDNIGIPNSSINLSLSDGSVNSPADGEILIALNQNHHPTAEYMRILRKQLDAEFPDLAIYFAPADIVSQVLNFGLAAPVDIQLGGSLTNATKDAEIIRRIKQDVERLPGIVDVRMQQVPLTPDLRVNVDRTLANQVGVDQQDVATDLLTSLSSSHQTAPNFWFNPSNGVNYSIYVQTPQYHMDSINDLNNTPIAPTAFAETPDNVQLLSNMASITRGASPTNVTSYNLKDTFDVLLGVQGTDLGSAAREINQVLAKYTPELPRGSELTLRGQIASMQDSFTGLAGGLVFAILLVYLLMVVNFQSWLDPLIILMALPGALAGILWILWATGTTISVPALMGAIMSVGVATANSILLITFANDQREIGMNARAAALSAGLTRLRPVLMTALAMIIGMLPMALGLGEGGEQNAPLGRAVIGGLAMATFSTLLFVPVVYSLLRGKPRQTHVEQELM